MNKEVEQLMTCIMEFANGEISLSQLTNAAELEKCPNCGAYDFELHSTEGKLNGGIGDVCISCLNDL